MQSETTNETTPILAPDQLWARVEATLPRAKAMYFDGCHKIYLAMDDTENARFVAEDWSHTNAPDIDLLRAWFEESCQLRFINAVTTNVEDPNAGYEHLIAQFDIAYADDDEADEDGASGASADIPNEDEQS